MKTICLGDIHGRDYWKAIIEKENPDRVIFIGDYFDSFDITGLEQLINFEQIILFKKTTNKEVILLIGNHDHHYFPEVGYSGTTGYQSGTCTAISFLLNENRKHLQMAYQFDNYLFSHAGIGETWLETHNWDKEQPIVEFVNQLWLEKPKDAFTFNGGSSRFSNYDSTGDSIGQTPIWIRPRSLMKDSQNLKKDYIQIFGHTQINTIDVKGKATGGRYFNIDILGSGEYLIIEDDKINGGKIIPI